MPQRRHHAEIERGAQGVSRPLSIFGIFESIVFKDSAAMTQKRVTFCSKDEIKLWGQCDNTARFEGNAKEESTLGMGGELWPRDKELAVS